MIKKLIATILMTGLILNTGATSVNATTGKVKWDDLEKIATQAIDEEISPGLQIVVSKGDDIVYSGVFGTIDDKSLVTKDTIYDLASLTKVLATNQAIMKLRDEGKVDLNKTVATYIPEFAKNGKENVTIKDLLTHTSGLTPWKPSFFYANNPKEELEYICNLPLEYERGQARKYSDFSFMTLGYIVEAVTGKTLDEYTESEIYRPLKMEHTMFIPLKHQIKWEIAPTSMGNPFEYKMVAEDDFGYKCEENADDFKGWRNYRLIGQVNDGNTWYAQGGVAGHAGLFSNAEDLSKLTRLMLNGGNFEGKHLYSKSTIDEFTSTQSKFGHGYGFEINRGGSNSGYMGLYADENFFGHTGFTGTQFVVDKKHDISVIILTNKQFYGVNDEGNYKSTWPMARKIMKTVYESGLVTYQGKMTETNVSYDNMQKIMPSYFVEWKNFILLDDFLELIKIDKNDISWESKEASENVPNGLKINYKGKDYFVKSFTVEGDKYIHIRDLAKIFKFDLEWNPETELIKLTKTQEK